MTRVAALFVCFLTISVAVPGAQPADSYSTISHVARIDGRDVKYTATAGTLPLKDASGKVTANMPADLQALGLKATVEQSRQFAWGEYLAALTKGNRLPEAERTAIAQKVSRFSGLSPEFI
jgi:hypothetical protein